ncbi:WD40-repeat-containing domain protein [Ganoderma leucocontextum]|nr:WD40-repeat-containing domain protein [Ganoderma leucocontextum]
MSPDGRQLVSTSDMRIDSMGYTEALQACTWSPDGALIASLSRVGVVHIWDGQTLEQRDLLEDSAPAVEYLAPPCLQFSPDRHYLAWASGYGCCIWRPLTGEQPKRLPSHPSRTKVCINALSFAPDSRRIATAHGTLRYGAVDLEECFVRIWDVATGAALAVLAGHSKRVADISFSSDGRSLVSASDDSSARIWDAASGEQTASLEDGGDAISKARFFSRREARHHYLAGKKVETLEDGRQVMRGSVY